MSQYYELFESPENSEFEQKLLNLTTYYQSFKTAYMRGEATDFHTFHDPIINTLLSMMFIMNRVQTVEELENA